MGILDDIITKENRPHLVGSPEEGHAVHTIYNRNVDFFHVSRGCRDYLAGARIKASKATTFTALREAVDARQKAHKRFIDAIYARYASA